MAMGLYGRVTYAGEIPGQLAWDTTGGIPEGGAVGGCDTQDDECDEDLEDADEPDPAECAGRGFVPGIDWKAQHLHDRFRKTDRVREAEVERPEGLRG